MYRYYNYIYILLVLSTVLQMAGVGFTVGTLAIFLEDQVQRPCYLILHLNYNAVINILQFNLTPDKVGLVFLSSSVFYVLTAPFAGKIADKIVSKRKPLF